MQIYINKDGQQFGPYSLDQLQQYVQKGHFTPRDYACHDGQNWVMVAQVPGFAAGGQAAAAQPQAQQVAQQHQQAQAAVLQQQTAAAVVVDAAAKKKKIILWSSIGGAAALIVAGLLIWAPWSGDDEEQVAEEESASKTSSPGPSASNPDPEPTDAGNVNPGHAALQLVPLIERIPAEALGVVTLDLKKILQKGGSKAASFIPADAPPFIRSILEDPSSIGLDVSEPVRAYFLRHPTKPDEEPSIGIAAKLEDSAKLKQFLQSMNAPAPTESKDGSDFWEIDEGEPYLAIASEFLFLIVNEDRRAGAQHLTKELDRFMTSDGSNSFVEAHPEYALQGRKGYDLGIWVDLEKVGSLAEGEVPDDLLGLVEAGTLFGGLRFDNGEAVLELNGASKGLGKALGGGGISSDLAKYLAADAPLVASISMSVDGLIDMLPDTLADADLDLDEPIEELGVAPREVLEVFQGGFAFSLTKLPPLGGGAPMEDEPTRNDFDPGETEPDIGNFGDRGSAGPPPNPFAVAPSGGGNPSGGVTSSEKDPFGGTSDPGVPEIAVDPPPDGFGDGPPPGGFPGGPPPGGPAANMPDFVVAASIDQAKWDALMQKSPQVAGLIALGQLMGITVKAENGILAVGTAKH
ncbi:MAG: DUF4836 family protein, partial [Opitutales bacterium]